MQLAISNSTKNNSTGPDDRNNGHLKYLGPLAIRYLTNMYNIVLNSNEIPKFWKFATIIPILELNKHDNIGTNYRSISFLSPIAKTLDHT